jgi:hypothetical protein
MIGHYLYSQVIKIMIVGADDDFTGELKRQVNGILNQWLSTVWDQGLVRTHPGALATGEDDRGEMHNEKFVTRDT